MKSLDDVIDIVLILLLVGLAFAVAGGWQSIKSLFSSGGTPPAKDAPTVAQTAGATAGTAVANAANDFATGAVGSYAYNDTVNDPLVKLFYPFFAPFMGDDSQSDQGDQDQSALAQLVGKVVSADPSLDPDEAGQIIANYNLNGGTQ